MKKSDGKKKQINEQEKKTKQMGQEVKAASWRLIELRQNIHLVDPKKAAAVNESTMFT